MENKKYINNNAYVTIALVVICIAMFLVETFFGGSENPATLLKLGAMNNYVVVAVGQWWRLFTAQFLHIGIWHLVSNIVMIYYVGMILEPMLGHWRFLVVYLLSGVGGNLLSLAFGTDNSIGAGASTALFGMFGAVVAVAWRNHNNPVVWYLGKQSLALALINLAIDVFLPHIDILGHIGGLVTGFLLTVILTDRLGKKYDPKLRAIAGALLLLYVVITVRQGMVISF